MTLPVPAGWSVGPWPTWAPGFLRRMSQAQAWARRIYLRDGLVEGSPSWVEVVHHEAAHARRAESMGRWRYLLAYLVSPRFRLADEVEATAHGVAALLDVVGADHSPDAAAAHTRKRKLGGWRYPYFTPGDPVTIERRIACRAMEIRGAA